MAAASKTEVARVTEWKHANPEKVKRYSMQERMRKHGLTADDYDRMLEGQGGVCAICGGVNANGRRLYVDHDHETNEVRGLLYHTYNSNLGGYEAMKKMESVVAPYLEAA